MSTMHRIPLGQDSHRRSGSTTTTTPPRHAPAGLALSPAPARPLGTCACGGTCSRCAGSGRPLDGALRASMQARLGAPLTDVRVHADAQAQATAGATAGATAHAFTFGSDVFFAAGKFAPNTQEGATRLAHELVHVEQQRRGQRGGALEGERGAEREARELGAASAAGARVTVRAGAPHAIQRDGPDPEGSAGTGLAPSSGPQLHLDPEIERLMLQHYIRWWLGTTLVSGDAPSTLPAAPDPDAYSDPEVFADAPAVPGIPGLPPAPIWSQLPLQPPLFVPLPPDPLFLEPDVGSLFSGFGQRGAPVGEGDSQMVFDIYRRNAAIARGLPDLRGMAPRFLQPLIPLTWRRDIAGALTGAAIGAGLKRDYMTPIEVSDQAFQRMTGASTTVIPLPSISFDLF